MNWLSIIVPIVLGGGFLGGLVAIMKLRPEAGQITVTAAQGAVIVQTGVIDSLVEENARLQGRIRTLEQAMATLAEAHARIQILEEENRELKEENIVSNERIGQLELELAGIKNGGI